ncbi:hypothetical protein PIROE2DRAFT_14640 [Piromyces sp. E2]|nr:hypothetical protein PIROE2DRAFT_14640 [Piromyces sp. E2]|eukprot:OUM59739.1 hypothetical protein PIROE2DRAFT_14640 [Piromyces sp. E2]
MKNRYFSENSKGSHEKVYLNSLEYIQRTITKIIDYQLFYVITVMSASIFIIILMILKGFIPILNKISKFKFCVVQLFRDISQDYVNKIIHFHEKQSRYYLNNYNNIIKNNPDDNENLEVKKNVFRDNSIIDLYSFIFVILITAIFMILPLTSIFVSIQPL